MKAFLYGAALQWKLDLRSKTMLITCYVVPLLFFTLMGGIFTAINPAAGDTLIPSMTVMGVSMGALIGLPPSLSEIYGSDIRKAYAANGAPMWFALIANFLSSFVHLLIMSLLIYCIAPAAFSAALPASPMLYFGVLALLIAVSLSIGSVLGLAVGNQAKLTMLSQLGFLPSILLSGILVPAGLLPEPLILLGKLFPATWGYRLMTAENFALENFWPLVLILAVAIAACCYMLKRLKAE